MYQGVINALKVKFKKQTVLKILNREKQGKKLKMFVLDAILMFSWNDVSNTTIKKCLRYARLQAAVNNEAEKKL